MVFSTVLQILKVTKVIAAVLLWLYGPALGAGDSSLDTGDLVAAVDITEIQIERALKAAFGGAMELAFPKCGWDGQAAASFAASLTMCARLRRLEPINVAPRAFGSRYGHGWSACAMERLGDEYDTLAQLREAGHYFDRDSTAAALARAFDAQQPRLAECCCYANGA